MDKSGSMMAFGRHPVAINLSWPAKEYVTLKEPTLMFFQVLKDANLPCAAYS